MNFTEHSYKILEDGTNRFGQRACNGGIDEFVGEEGNEFW